MTRRGLANRLVVVATVLAAQACAPRPFHHREVDVVMLVRLDADVERARELPATLVAASATTTWYDLDISAPGLAGVFSLLSPLPPPRSPLPPSPESLSPPAGWRWQWLRWPSSVARLPEELRWAPLAEARSDSGATVEDHRLLVAVFTQEDFEREGEAWIATLPPPLRPPSTGWIVVDLPAAQEGPAAFARAASGAEGSWPHAIVRWVGPGSTDREVRFPISSREVAGGLTDFGRGRVPEPVRLTALRTFRWASEEGGGILHRDTDRVWQERPQIPLDLWVRVVGSESMDFLDIDLRALGGFEERRPWDLEEIDDLEARGSKVERMLLAVGPRGDGAIYALRDPAPRLRLNVPGLLATGGFLGVPIHAGPTGQPLGTGVVSIRALSRNAYRCRSELPPAEAQLRDLAPGVHLWLVPRDSTTP